MLNYRFKNVKEKLNDISGELDDMTNKKITGISNISTIYNTKKTNGKQFTETSFLDNPLESGRTFSMNSSILENG